MQQSGCEDIVAVRQLLYNNCGNLDATISDLLTLVNPVTENNVTRSEKIVAPPPAVKTNVTRKQMEKIRKQERKFANEARKKAGTEKKNSQASHDNLLVCKVQCLNI